MRYEITAPPLTLYACHCHGCQTQSGSAFGMSMLVPGAGVAFVQGTPQAWRRRGGSGREQDCLFCPGCGTRLMHRPVGPGPGMMVVKPGTLDDTSWIAPAGHLWTLSAPPWTLPLRDGPCWAESPPDFQTLLAAWKSISAPQDNRG